MINKIDTIHPKNGCPFCGAPAESCYPKKDEKLDGAWAVICGECGANGPLFGHRIGSPAIAIEEWDARAK